MSFARITKLTHFSLLEGKRVLNPAVEFQGLCDIRPGPNPPIFNAGVVHFSRCHDDFVRHWLTPTIFSNPQLILLDSHPGHPEVLKRFPKAKYFLPERLTSYKTQWAIDQNNVQLAKDSTFFFYSLTHGTEPLRIAPK